MLRTVPARRAEIRFGLRKATQNVSLQWRHADLGERTVGSVASFRGTYHIENVCGAYIFCHDEMGNSCLELSRCYCMCPGFERLSCSWVLAVREKEGFTVRETKKKMNNMRTWHLIWMYVCTNYAHMSAILCSCRMHVIFCWRMIGDFVRTCVRVLCTCSCNIHNARGYRSLLVYRCTTGQWSKRPTGWRRVFSFHSTLSCSRSTRSPAQRCPGQYWSPVYYPA